MKIYKKWDIDKDYKVSVFRAIKETLLAERMVKGSFLVYNIKIARILEILHQKGVLNNDEIREFISKDEFEIYD